jgi:hypothetical protein
MTPVHSRTLSNGEQHVETYARVSSPDPSEVLKGLPPYLAANVPEFQVVAEAFEQVELHRPTNLRLLFSANFLPMRRGGHASVPFGYPLPPDNEILRPVRSPRYVLLLYPAPR